MCQWVLVKKLISFIWSLFCGEGTQDCIWKAPKLESAWATSLTSYSVNVHFNIIHNIYAGVLRSEICDPFLIFLKFSFIHHSVFCLTTGPKPHIKRFLHIVRSRASSFKWEYPLLFLRLSSSFLRFLPRLLVTSISPFIFPSTTCFRRQFLRKMWPIQLAFRFLISCRIFLCSLTLSNTSSFLTWSVQLIFSILLQHHISKFSRHFLSAAYCFISAINQGLFVVRRNVLLIYTAGNK